MRGLLRQHERTQDRRPQHAGLKRVPSANGWPKPRVATGEPDHHLGSPRLSFLQQAEARGEPRLTGDSSMTLREHERRERQRETSHRTRKTKQRRKTKQPPAKGSRAPSSTELAC